MGEAARQRWAVVASHWSPPPQAFEYLLSLLPAEEREQCNRFRQAEDRKRALVSRLLARAAAAAALRLQPFSTEALVGWARTRGGKPYVASPLPRPPHAPNWNYSVSHEVRGWWLKRRCRCHTHAVDQWTYCCLEKHGRPLAQWPSPHLRPNQRSSHAGGLCGAGLRASVHLWLRRGGAAAGAAGGGAAPGRLLPQL